MSEVIEVSKRVLSERDRLTVRSAVLGDMYPSRESDCKAVLLQMIDGVTDAEAIAEITLMSRREVDLAINMLQMVGIVDDAGICVEELEKIDQQQKRELLSRLIAKQPDSIASMFRSDSVEIGWARVRSTIGYRDVYEAIREIELPLVEVRGENVSASVLRMVLQAVVDHDGVVEVLPKYTSLSLVTCRRALDGLATLGLICEPKERQVQIDLQAVAAYRPAPSVADAGKVA